MGWCVDSHTMDSSHNSQGVEAETKYPVTMFGPLRTALEQAGATRCSLVFEQNTVFDATGRLRAAGMLLRVRRTVDASGTEAARLTVKTPLEGAKDDPTVKRLRELETPVGSFDTLCAMLEVLGYAPALAYEKVRETWQLDTRDGTVEVVLDRLPFGNFVELEGPQDALEPAAQVLGLPVGQGTSATYHDLHQQWRGASGLGPQADFIFDEPLRTALQAAPALSL